MADRYHLDTVRAFLPDYLRQRGLPLHKAFRCLNPEHEDKHPSMRYYESRLTIHCFSCGTSYDLFDLLGLDYNLGSFSECYKKACTLFGISDTATAIPSLALSQKNPLDKEPASDMSEQLRQLRTQSREELSYFLGRGITEESCKKYGFFQTDERAYFPVYEKNHCKGWCGRAISSELEPRYKNSRGSLGLWNIDYLLRGKGGEIFLTEGIVDGVCLEQMGYSAVAICGSQNTAKLIRWCGEHLQAANRWSFIACGDPDEAGRKMNQSLAEQFKSLGISCRVMYLEETDKDIADLYQHDRQRLALLLEQVVQQREIISGGMVSAAEELDVFFAESRKRGQKSVISTGFHKWDNLLAGGLHTGLYMLGAISSLGKTSLLLQVADNISEQGNDVLFFSLEQSKFELMAKSLSRISAELDSDTCRLAFTTRQLLGGAVFTDSRQKELLCQTREAYGKMARHLFIREGIADIGVEEIRSAVREHIQQRGMPPVVMIDYLQILRPVDPRGTDKQNVDKAVVELKRISRDFDLPVIAVSSFNRENYRMAVSMEAFKESGAVEYSSDVLLGLQLKGAGKKDFDVNAEKSREPRTVELVMLKNRNGVPYGKVDFEYYARFSLFKESANIKATYYEGAKTNIVARK